MTLFTYGFASGFVSTDPDAPFYPYPALDFSKVAGPAHRAFPTVTLENGYVSVTLLPELGGRIYQWLDKSTGRQLLYNNPVIKPTHWGFRGWWLAIGGIEWAFPVEEHGLNEWRPWSYRLGADSITVWDIDDRTGMEVGAVVRLDTSHAYLQITPYARNDTALAQRYQLWLNAMLSLAGNHISDQTRILLPPTLVTVHSTGDPSLPSPGAHMNWPFSGGRDLSWLANWNSWLGFFAPSNGFTGIYDYASDQGILRTHTPGWPVGTKIFAPRGLSPSDWTDDASDYLELWSGNVPTFWDYATLEPGQAVSWTEYWYPVHGLGGLTLANAQAALRLDDDGARAELGLAVTTYTEGELQLFSHGQLVARWSVAIYPGQAWRTSWSRPSDATGPLGLRLLYADNTVAIQVGAVP